MKGLFRALNRSSLHSTCASHKSTSLYMLWVVVWKTHALFIAHEWLQLKNITGVHWFYLLFYSGQSDAITSCSLLFSWAWCWGIGGSHFLALALRLWLWVLTGSYDNFFPQIRTHSQISTLPDLGHNVKRVSLSKSVTPFPPPLSLFYILVGIQGNMFLMPPY